MSVEERVCAYLEKDDEPITIASAHEFTGANSHTGAETHTGVETHTGAETHAGNETHSGTEVFSVCPTVIAAGTAAGRGCSPLIWDDCPYLKFLLDPTSGWVYFNDFIHGNYAVANNQTVAHLGNGVSGFTAATAGTTITQLADELGGVIALNNTTDDEDSGIFIGGGAGAVGTVKFASGKQIWMEARIKSLNITDSKFGIFCGFAEEGLCATTALIGADDALSDKDYVGFHKLAADGDKLDTVYNTATGGGAVSLKTDAVTIEADTYMKVGMHFDGTTLTLYADGVALADTVAYNAAKFPDGEQMGFYFVSMSASDDTDEACIDWVRIAAEL